MALEIARDRTASVPARVFAIRALLWTLQPGGVITYADLVDERPDGRPRVCFGGTPLHLRLTRGEPISPDYADVIHRAGAQAEADLAEPEQIRIAAFCMRFRAIDLTGR